jgi:hypothetical protein
MTNWLRSLYWQIRSRWQWWSAGRQAEYVTSRESRRRLTALVDEHWRD